METRKYRRGNQIVQYEYDYNQVRVKEATKKKVVEYAKDNGMTLKGVVELALWTFFNRYEE